MAEIQPLNGWILLSDAARILGLTRQGAADLLNRGEFKTARTVGRQRIVYIVQEKEVLALHNKREKS